MTLDELQRIFIHVVKDNFCSFKGRASRYEFWWFYLISIIVACLCSIGDAIIGWPGIIGGIWSLIVFLPQLGLDVRRLHDINRSGWWLLVACVPVIGWILLLVWALQKGDEGANDYGEAPAL